MSNKVLPLTKGFVAIVSSADWRSVSKYKWYAHISAGTKKKPGAPYARANINGKKVYLHRYVMRAELEASDFKIELLDVDHKNHQTLDCRRENLAVLEKKINSTRRRCVKVKAHE